MQLEMNVDCGCEGWKTLMSMSVSALSLSTHYESGPEVAGRRAHREAACYHRGQKIAKLIIFELAISLLSYLRFS